MNDVFAAVAFFLPQSWMKIHSHNATAPRLIGSVLEMNNEYSSKSINPRSKNKTVRISNCQMFM